MVNINTSWHLTDEDVKAVIAGTKIQEGKAPDVGPGEMAAASLKKAARKMMTRRRNILCTLALSR